MSLFLGYALCVFFIHPWHNLMFLLRPWKFRRLVISPILWFPGSWSKVHQPMTTYLAWSEKSLFNTGIGGAMDLVSNPDKTKVIVIMEHTTKHGSPKILKKCSLPLTGARAVSQIITELAVFDVNRKEGGLVLVEVQEGATIEEIREKTGCDFKVRDGL
jgi:hypothetical protein